MLFKQRGARLALGVLLFVGALACRTTDTFISQAKPTSTRTPRPTFTPFPTATEIVEPTIPVFPTALPALPTKKPTTRPTVKPSPRPPTAPPPGPTQPPAPQPTQPPAFQWIYHANPPSCEHSGGTFIEGTVYANVNDPNSGTPDMRVAMGGADGGTPWIPPVTTNYSGKYTFVLSDRTAKPGTYYVWVLDGAGKRISEVGGPVKTNNLGPDAPGVCWKGFVDFWK